jgi:site-specific recombinase XerD
VTRDPPDEPPKPHNRDVNAAGNQALLNDYQIYLRVEKGLRPLTCEAYLSDLRTFAEFLEGRYGVLLSATQQDVSAFSNICARTASTRVRVLAS